MFPSSNSFFKYFKFFELSCCFFTAKVFIFSSEYIRLLSAASVDDTTKLSRVDDKPQTFVDAHRNIITHFFRRRKMYIQSYIEYCLKTLSLRCLLRVQDWPIFMGFLRHTKPNVCMTLILSATGTYNFNLAKWLEKKT